MGPMLDFPGRGNKRFGWPSLGRTVLGAGIQAEQRPCRGVVDPEPPQTGFDFGIADEQARSQGFGTGSQGLNKVQVLVKMMSGSRD